MVDFSRVYRKCKPEGVAWTEQDLAFFEMICRHIKIGIDENRLAVVEVCVGLLEAFLKLRLEAISCEQC